MRGLLAEEFFDAGHVVGNVHAHGVVLDFGDPDFPAVLKPAELLELLDFFQFALGQRRVLEQGIALKDV